jgi:ribosomal protein S26
MGKEKKGKERERKGRVRNIKCSNASKQLGNKCVIRQKCEMGVETTWSTKVCQISPAPESKIRKDVFRGPKGIL